MELALFRPWVGTNQTPQTLSCFIPTLSWHTSNPSETELALFRPWVGTNQTLSWHYYNPSKTELFYSNPKLALFRPLKTELALFRPSPKVGIIQTLSCFIPTLSWHYSGLPCGQRCLWRMRWNKWLLQNAFVVTSRCQSGDMLGYYWCYERLSKNSEHSYQKMHY